ncbi:hypothetical protein QR680_005799 [Steinernema hermaphroditum]|uniref:Galectin n=1 Tax=Steinernema hermaphroditum TaxID=289476 RepID=A0AA39HTE7_9BILA|nr:hypothetical protein QR680_005799 [Steinernema hermaphroditum]
MSFASAPLSEDSDSIVHHNVEMPYVCNIPDGMFVGRAIAIRGMVKPKGSSDSTRFRIDLCCGLLVQGDHTDNKALHFNPRFDSGGLFSGRGDRDIVLNTLINNGWGQEERFANVFKEGEQFHIRILCLTQFFKISVNGKHLCDYLHRIPCEQIRTIYIDGAINVDFVEYQGEPPIAHLHPTQNIHLDKNPIQYGPVFKPKIPFAYKLERLGIFEHQLVHITGTPHMNAERFSINLKAGEEYFLHIRADFPTTSFPQGAVVRNSTLRGAWQVEERYMSAFPFHKGITFDLVLKMKLDRIEIAINGANFAHFKFRGDVDSADVDTVSIVGDVTVQQFSLK